MGNTTVEMYVSFIDEDRDFYHHLQAHLSPLEGQGRIHLTSGDDILPGDDEQATRKALLKRTSILVLLVSPMYLQSDQHAHEVAFAMHQHEAKKARVVPILLKPCAYEEAPFAGLQILPRNEKPITRWGDRDAAFLDITNELKTLLKEFPLRASSEGLASLWTVPYPRNSLFTGREAELHAIETTLRQGQPAAIGQTQAISGLGGIGKTQIALEYAYRHRHDYRYIFWVLADTRDTLNADYSKLAALLDLPGKDQAEVRYIVEAVKSWLEKNQDWLLILDNADDLTIIPDFLPLSTAPGHILLTTRSQALGRLAERIEARKLDAREGVAFLVSRSASLNPYTRPASIDAKEYEAAHQIVRELDGLPLALDQAGAYIEETSCGFQGYLSLYRKEHKELLKVRGGHISDHPNSVVQTVQMALKKVEKANPSAADLLRLCAFLAPEDIPELIIERGEAEFPGQLKQLSRKPLKLNAAIADLQKYSLLLRNAAAKTLEVHRLVQVVVKDIMTKNVEQAWATRVVRVMEHVFPWPQPQTWGICLQLLPHAQECVALIARWHIEIPECQHLLNSLGTYHYGRAEYREAQKYFEKALSSAQNMVGKGSRQTAAYLNNLALVYRGQGKHAEALRLHEQALEIRRKLLGEEHPETAISLGNLALVYQAQGKYAEALGLHEQALEIRRKLLGEEHPETASSLGNLALVYREQGKHAEALRLHEQALEIQRKLLGEEHLEVGMSLNNLAETYLGQGRYDRSERLHQQALVLLRKALGDEHPLIATSLNNRGELFLAQERCDEARDLFQRALALQRKVWDEAHPDIARSVHNLGRLSLTQGAYEEARAFFQQALAMRRAKLGENHSKTQETLACYEETIRAME